MFHRLVPCGLALALLLLFGTTTSAQQPEPPTKGLSALPLSASPSKSYYVESVPMTMPQQRAQFEAEQRMLRLEFNKWIGYSPLRPNMNSSYMSNGVQRYYLPTRGTVVSAGNAYQWYW